MTSGQEPWGYMNGFHVYNAFVCLVDDARSTALSGGPRRGCQTTKYSLVHFARTPAGVPLADPADENCTAVIVGLVGRDHPAPPRLARRQCA